MTVSSNVVRSATRKQRPHRISAHIYVDLLVRKIKDAPAIEHRHVDSQRMNEFRFDLVKLGAEQGRRSTASISGTTRLLRADNVVEGRAVGEALFALHRTSTSTCEGTLTHRSSAARRGVLWSIRADR